MKISRPAPFLLTVLLLCAIRGPCPALSTSAEDLQAMKTLLKRTGLFQKFVKFWNTANAAAGNLEQAPFWNFYNITVLAPINPAFNKISKSELRNPRCYDAKFAPNGCTVPITLFHVFQETITAADFKAAANGTVWNSLSGYGIQKIVGLGGRWGFILTPEVGGDFGANSVNPVEIVYPGVYQSKDGNVTVHGIDTVLPPPILYPNGF